LVTFILESRRSLEQPAWLLRAAAFSPAQVSDPATTRAIAALSRFSSMPDHILCSANATRIDTAELSTVPPRQSPFTDMRPSTATSPILQRRPAAQSPRCCSPAECRSSSATISNVKPALPPRPAAKHPTVLPPFASDYTALFHRHP